jgi:ABC-type antimicrobial peptide transport system permease subunit
MANDSKGFMEASFIGFGFGGVLGGLVVGSAADVLGAPVNSLLAYFVGGVLGALAGLVAGRVAASALL